MLNRLPERKIRQSEKADRFARTAHWVFVLSFFLFPVFLAIRGANDGETLEGTGGFFVFVWLFGLKLAVTMYIPAMLVGALSFFVLYKLTTKVVGSWVGAIVASPVAAYFSVLVSFHLDIDFFPPGWNWDSGNGSFSFSNSLGSFAAFLSVPVSAITFLGAKHGG